MQNEISSSETADTSRADADGLTGVSPSIDSVLVQLDDAMHSCLDSPLVGDFMTLTRSWRIILEDFRASLRSGAPVIPPSDAQFRDIVAPLLFSLSGFLDAEAPAMLALEASDPERFARWHGIANETHKTLQRLRAPVVSNAAKNEPTNRANGTPATNTPLNKSVVAVGSSSAPVIPDETPRSLVELVREYQDAHHRYDISDGHPLAGEDLGDAHSRLLAFDLPTREPGRPAVGEMEAATVTRGSSSSPEEEEYFEYPLRTVVIHDPQKTINELRSALEGAERDTKRIEWLEKKAGEWSLGFVAMRGKWRIEGPDDELIDQRFLTAREAIDAAASSGGNPE